MRHGDVHWFSIAMLVYQAGMLSSESPETIIPRENSEGKDQMDPRNLMNFNHLMLQDVTCNKWIFDDIWIGIFDFKRQEDGGCCSGILENCRCKNGSNSGKYMSFETVGIVVYQIGFNPKVGTFE